MFTSIHYNIACVFNHNIFLVPYVIRFYIMHVTSLEYTHPTANHVFFLVFTNTNADPSPNQPTTREGGRCAAANGESVAEQAARVAALIDDLFTA